MQSQTSTSMHNLGMKQCSRTCKSTDLDPVCFQLDNLLRISQCCFQLPRLQACQRTVAIETVIGAVEGNGLRVQLNGFVVLSLFESCVPTLPQIVGLSQNTRYYPTPNLAAATCQYTAATRAPRMPHHTTLSVSALHRRNLHSH